jgi:hypothetical protein
MNVDDSTGTHVNMMEKLTLKDHWFIEGFWRYIKTALDLYSWMADYILFLGNYMVSQKCKAENTHPICMFHKVEQCMKMKMRHCEKWLIQLPFYKYLLNCGINLCHQHRTWKLNCSILHCFVLCL